MIVDNKKIQSKRKWIRAVWNVVGQLAMAVAIYFLIDRLIGNGNQVIKDLRQIAMAPGVEAGLLTLLMLLLMPLGWVLALRAVGVTVTYRLGFVIYYRVSILHYLPGSIWNFPGRAYLCHKRGILLSDFARSTFLELFFLITIAVALSGCGIALRIGSLPLLALSIIIPLTMMLAISWLFPWMAVRIKSICGLDLTIGAHLQKRFLLMMAIVYSVVWISYGLAISLLLLALPDTPSFNTLHVILLSVAAWTGGFLSPSPAGMGVREISLSTLMGPTFSTTVLIASLSQRAMEIFLEGLLWIFSKVFDK